MPTLQPLVQTARTSVSHTSRAFSSFFGKSNVLVPALHVGTTSSTRRGSCTPFRACRGARSARARSGKTRLLGVSGSGLFPARRAPETATHSERRGVPCGLIRAARPPGSAAGPARLHCLLAALRDDTRVSPLNRHPSLLLRVCLPSGARSVPRALESVVLTVRSGLHVCTWPSALPVPAPADTQPLSTLRVFSKVHVKFQIPYTPQEGSGESQAWP